MTPDQLAVARANRWHQDARPLLTLEDASTWMKQMQLALYLPRKAHVLAPAPSFVEAVSGIGNATPASDAIANAAGLLARLVQEGTVVPLNLFGTPGEQPDFLVATTALPHLAALQADRNWKKPPSKTGPGKVSPMAIEVWKLLEREGALTANEIREQLGHELTEAATIRGLSELWQNMRVAPLPSEDNEAANWQILSVTHKKEMAAGGTMSQSAALSMLVSNYLQSIITGTAEDVEAFLSPVASRSRLRDVVRGLTATRQLRTLSMDAQTFLFIDGTLPEMPETVAAGGTEAEAKPAFMGRTAYRERMLNRGKETDSQTEEAADNKNAPNGERPAFRSDRPQRFAPGAAPTFRKRSTAGSDRFNSGQRSSGDAGSGRPGSNRGAFSKPRFGSKFGAGRTTHSQDERPRDARRDSNSPQQNRPFSGRPSRPYRPAAGGAASAGAGRTGSDRPRFGSARPGTGDRPRTDRPYSKPADGGSFRPRPTGDRGQERPGFSKRPPFRGSAEDRGGSQFKPRANSDRPSADRRPFRPREDARPGGSGDSRNSSRAGFASRTGGRPGRPAGDRPRPDRASGDRPSAGRPRPPRAEGDRPYTSRPRTEGDRDSRPPRRFDSKPSFQRRDRPSTGEDRPPRREGSSSGYPSNPNRPSRAPRPPGSFASREKGPADRRPGGTRPGTGRPASSNRPQSRSGSAKPGSGDRGRSGAPGRTPGRNPGGTGRPGGPRVGGGRPFSAKGGSRLPGQRSGPPRPGGMRPPTRKPRPEKETE